MPYVRLVNTAANLKILDGVENIDSIFMLANLAARYPLDRLAATKYILFGNDSIRPESIALAETALRNALKDALLKVIIKAYPVTFSAKNISKGNTAELILDKYEELLKVHKHLDSDVFEEILLTIETHARKLLELITIEKATYNVGFRFKDLTNNLYEYEVKEVVNKTPKADSSKFRAAIISFVNKINKSILYVDYDFIHKIMTIDSNKKMSLSNKYRTYEIDTYDTLYKMFFNYVTDKLLTTPLESGSFYTDYMLLYKYKDLTSKTKAAYYKLCRFIHKWLMDVKVEAIINGSSKDGCVIRVRYKKDVVEKEYYSSIGNRRKAVKSK